MQSPPPPPTVLESNSRTENFLFDLVQDLRSADEDSAVTESSKDGKQDEEENTQEAEGEACQQILGDDDPGQIVSDGLGEFIGKLAKKVLPSKKGEPPLSAEDEIDQNLNDIEKAVQKMKEMVVTMGGEIDSQIEHLDHLNTEVAATHGKVKHATDRVNDLLDK